MRRHSTGGRTARFGSIGWPTREARRSPLDDDLAAVRPIAEWRLAPFDEASNELARPKRSVKFDSCGLVPQI